MFWQIGLKKNSYLLGVISLFLFAFLIRLGLIFQDGLFILTHLLPDDAYYYFQVAKNLANGAGSTFDGLHLTNGYHPLWMGFNWIIFRFFPQGGDTPIRILLVLATLFELGSGVLIYFLSRRFFAERWIALFTTAIFLLNPWAIAHGLNGLETAISTVCLLLTAWCTVMTLSIRKERRWVWLVTLSVSVGLTILSRVDLGLWMMVLAVFLLWHVRRVWCWKDYMAAIIPGVVILAIVGAFWTIRFGTPAPQSGFAFTLVNRTLFFYKARSFVDVVLWCGFKWLSVMRFAAAVSGVSWGFWILMGGFLCSMVQRIRRHQLLREGERVVLWLCISLLLHTLLHGAIRWSAREWYFSFSTVLVALLFGWYFDRFPLLKPLRFLVLFFLCVSFFLTNPLLHSDYQNQQEILAVARQLVEKTPAGARIGSFNAGILGYYSPARRVTNLDGLINISAYHALRDKRLKEYLYEQGIDYLVDYDIAIQYRYFPFWGTTDLSFLRPKEQLSGNSAYHNSRIYLYEVIK